MTSLLSDKELADAKDRLIRRLTLKLERLGQGGLVAQDARKLIDFDAITFTPYVIEEQD